MIRGGIADKLGNRYEAKWLVRQMLRVAYGQREWIRFEGLPDTFRGFEFAVGGTDFTEWHQTKVTSSNGNWTVRALINEGVLAAFKRRLIESDHSKCFFVSEDPSKEARSLSRKARTAISAEEYEANLAEAERLRLTDLSEHWEVSKAHTWQLLQRCFFDVLPGHELDSIIETIGQTAYDVRGGVGVFAALRDFMEKRFNQVIRTEDLRDRLPQDCGLTFQDWRLDPTIRQTLTSETQAYLDTYTPFGVGGAKIRRREISEIWSQLFDEEANSIVLVTGVAGSGKSGVIRELIERLRAENIVHLAFRVDQFLDCRKAEDFGRRILNRDKKLVSALKVVAQEEPAVLIIDQVDAVSEVSGRDGAIRNAILQTTRDIPSLQTVKVVLVCRHHDFENDRQLKHLAAELKNNRIEVQLLEWDADISPVLTEAGFDIDQFSNAQKELLRLPLNLSVFMEIADPKLRFSSRDDLFRALIRQKSKDIRSKHQPNWSLMQPLESLAGWMSDRQRLDAPISILDKFPGAEDILASEGLVVRNNEKVNFFHESFFDYAFASKFSTSSTSLLELLQSSEQHLFRRTQCRQILEVMRQSDRPRFLDAISGVLLGTEVRFHIKLAIAQWLGAVADPTEAERKMALQLDDPTKPFDALAEAILFRSPQWFDLHLNAGWIEELLNDTSEQRKWAAHWMIRNVVGERPSEVAALLQSWWDADRTRSTEVLKILQSFIRAPGNRELQKLCVDVIRSKPDGLFSEAQSHRREMVLATWVDENVDGGGQVLAAFFDVWFDLHPGEHPFHYSDVKSLDLYSISQLAKKAPGDFLEAALPAFNRSLQIIAENEANGQYDRTFGSLSDDEHPQGDDEFLGLLRTALRARMAEAPAQTLSLLSQIEPASHNAAMNIHLEAVLGNPSALVDHFVTIAHSEVAFQAGWSGTEWSAFANAAASVFPHLEFEQKSAIEAQILDWRPEYELAKRLAPEVDPTDQDGFHSRSHIMYLLNESGFEQWCILNAINSQLLTPLGADRLRILNRKFSRKKEPEHRRVRSYWIGPPIRAERAKYMSDRDWLRAIKKYDQEEGWPRGPEAGGYRELGNVLKECAKGEPSRFVRLMLSIPDSAPNAYIASILSAVSECEACDADDVRLAIKDAHQRPDQPYGYEISRVLTRFPELTTDQTTFDILLHYAENGDAQEDSSYEEEVIARETSNVEQLLEFGEGLRIRGVNGARGEAVEALERVLWNVPDRTLDLYHFVSNRVRSEPLISVRCALTAPIVPLYNHDREACGELMELLVSAYSISGSSLPPPNGNELMPLATRDGIRIMPYLLYGAPNSARRLIDRLEASDDENLRMIAALHIIRAGFQHDDFISRADQLIQLGGQYRQLAAGIAASVISVAEFQDRAASLLEGFFDDTDEEVRRRASRALAHLDPSARGLTEHLLDRYLASRSFDGQDYALFDLLKKCEFPVTDKVIAAAETLLDEYDRIDNVQFAQRDFHYLQELIQAEYASSEDDPDLRRRLLDIIDRLLERRVSGTETILEAHDRAA